MLAFALPGVAVEIEAALMGRAVVTPVAIAPTVIPGKMFGAAEGPHVVQGPHDRLADAGDVCNREHLALHPMQVHDVGIGGVEALRPTGWHDRWRVDDWVAGVQQLSPWRGQLRADMAHGLGPFAGGALHCPITRGGHIHKHLRVDAGAAQGVMDAIGRAGGAAVDIAVVELENLQRAGNADNRRFKLVFTNVSGIQRKTFSACEE